MNTNFYQKKEIETFISTFKQEFYQKFNVIPYVKFQKTLLKKNLSVKEILDCADALIDLNAYPEGVKTLSRKRELVILRQCVCKIAKSYGHSLKSIKEPLNLCHATVLHAIKTIDNLIESGDKNAIQQLNDLEYEINKRHGDDGNV